MDAHTRQVKQRAAEYVTKAREAAGLTPLDVSRTSGVSRTKVYDIEAGRGQTKPETYARVVKALGRDPEEVLAILRGASVDVAASPGSSSEAILEAIAADVRRVLENQERLGAMALGMAERFERIELAMAPPSPSAPPARTPRKRSTVR